MITSPTALQLILDLKCNNNCTICGAEWPYRPSLDTTQAVSRLHSGIVLGIREVVLSGGEVTLRRDLVELVATAKQLGYETIVVLTNGRLLKPNLTTALVESGVTSFGTTLYGHTSEIHEQITRTCGSFAQTVKGIKVIQRYSHVPLSVNFVVSPTNFHYVSDAVDFLIGLDVRIIQLTYVVPVGKAKGIFYKRDMPSMSETLPFVRDAVDIFYSHYKDSFHRSISIAFYPFCVLRGLEAFSGTIYQSRAYFASENGDLVPVDVEIERHKLKIKRSECKLCTFDGLCDGVWQEYVNVKGWSEFVPITDCHPADVIPEFF